MNEKVYVVTASYQKEGGDLDYTTNIGVYKSKEGATKALIDVAIEYLPCYDCESAIIGYNHKDYMWGEWDKLAVTADKKGDPDDDDYYDLSQEEILELIRKAGRVYVETETRSGMELKSSKPTLNHKETNHAYNKDKAKNNFIFYRRRVCPYKWLH